MELQLTAVFRKVPEGYTGFVEELPGGNTQGTTLEEARANLREAVTLVLVANKLRSRGRHRASGGRSSRMLVFLACCRARDQHRANEPTCRNPDSRCEAAKPGDEHQEAATRR